ncbi:MFS transporter [Corynebacterium sp. LK2510]|uniref:MFS transporter n=1 Tax=Corynebacterium sp. LK2510 TaxID=3110472 RepID=UPI0034CF58CE
MVALLLFAAVITVAINLRAGLASVGPVLDDVITAYDAPASVGGIITALPALLFCIVGLTAVPAARRVGLTPALSGAALVMTMGLALRPFAPTITAFVVATFAVAAGIAVGNVLGPAWIKKYAGRYMVPLTTVYSVFVCLSASIGPLSALITDSWQVSLGVWAIAGAIQLIVWLIVLIRVGFDTPRVVTPVDSAPELSIYRSRTAVALMLFFGLQSMNAYVQLGWLPSILGEQGVSDSVATIGLACIGLLAALGGLTLPTVVERFYSLTPLVLLFGTLTAAGYVGILVAPAAAPILWCCLLGLGGWCFPLSIALIPSRTRNALTTARLAGFVQPFGSAIAAAGPLLVGVVHGIVQSYTPILIALIVLAIIMGLLGVVASRRLYIEDELAG